MSKPTKIIKSNSRLEILHKLNELQGETSVRAVILSFKDELNFEGKIDLVAKIEQFPKPIITLINQQAKGFLFELVLASHICIATEDAGFEISNKEKLLKQVGSKNIQKLKLYENNIDAKTAFELGLINKLVLQDEIEKEALEIADKMSKLAPLAIEFCLKAVNKGLNVELKDGLELETELFCQVFATKDMKEGTSAFLEKRKPKFSGK